MRDLEISLEVTDDLIKEKFAWSRQKLCPLDLYPAIMAEKKNNPQKPTQEEFKQAKQTIEAFHLFHHVKVIVLDQSDHHALVAIIEFVPLDWLSEQDKKDINFVTTFLHCLKKFVNPVGPSRSWGGKMWAIGWQKLMNPLELFGRYVKKSSIRSSPQEYAVLNLKANKVSQILGQMFCNLAKLAFESNRDTMKDSNIPSFSLLEFGSKPTPFDCSPHLTFTLDSFYNSPHIDKGNISGYSFLLVVPTKKSNGRLIEDTHEYQVLDGQFVFPDLGFGIDFKQKGIVKMVWAANKYKHCTFPAVDTATHTRMAMSLQINKKTQSTCRDMKNGQIYSREKNINKNKKDLYIGGVKNALKRCCSKK